MSYYNQQRPPVGVLPPIQGYPYPPKDAYPPPGHPAEAYAYPTPPYAAPPPPQQQQEPSFLEGCLAALCCCCLLDALLLKGENMK